MTGKNTTDPASKPKRRTFTADCKLRIVAEHDACTTAAERGALLRRERLYHSHIIEWRNARDAGALDKLTDRRTSPTRAKKHPAQAEADRLRTLPEGGPGNTESQDRSPDLGWCWWAIQDSNL